MSIPDEGHVIVFDRLNAHSELLHVALYSLTCCLDTAVDGFSLRFVPLQFYD